MGIINSSYARIGGLLVVHSGSVTRVAEGFSESSGVARHVCYSLSSKVGTREPVDTSQAGREASQLVVALWESANVCDINNPIWKVLFGHVLLMVCSASESDTSWLGRFTSVGVRTESQNSLRPGSG